MGNLSKLEQAEPSTDIVRVRTPTTKELTMILHLRYGAVIFALLSATSIATAATSNNRQDASRGPQSNTTVYKLNANQNRQVQQSLNQDGFRAGRVDGAIGSHTQRALREFQHQQGLQLTGCPDAETLLMLGIVGAEMQNLGRANGR
jgi:peptidoglycan hydrolase-like protein with peptidoglycan-binding domain